MRGNEAFNPLRMAITVALIVIISLSLYVLRKVLGDVALWLTYAAVATVGPVSAAVVRARDVRPAVVLVLAVQGGSSFLAYAAVMALAIWSIRSPTARQAGVLQRRFLRPLRSR
jgi:hypothetical protein